MPDLHVEGPYEIPYRLSKTVKQIRREDVTNDFWENNSTDAKHLVNKQGCYVFALRAGKGHTPWYVGKAGTGKKGKGFKDEIFQPGKLNNYNRVLFEYNFGKPVMFFVTLPDAKRVIPNSSIDHMEKELIQFACLKNPNLTNIANTKNLPKWSIKGVVRASQGQPTKAATSFKKMMRI